MLEVFETIAAREGVAPEEVYREVQYALDLAWEDPQFRRRIILLTHSLRKPDPDSFVILSARISKDFT